MSERKVYILDTSCLVHDANCLSVFAGNDIILPIAVLTELDHLKIKMDNTGANARIIIKKIESFCKDAVSINEGIDIGNDIRLFIDVEHTQDLRFHGVGKDDEILACASYHKGILVSKDVNLRLRARCFGVSSEDYKNDTVISAASEIYTGFRDVELTEHIEGFSDHGLSDVVGTIFEDMFPNEFVQVTSNNKNSIFRRVNDSLKPVRLPADTWGLKPLSKEQAYCLDLLLDQNVPLVMMCGRSGSGKSLLTMGAALELTINQKVYNKIEIFRPLNDVGGNSNTVGILPGGLEEKLGPIYSSVIDTFSTLFGPDYERKLGQYKEKIKFEPIAYLRGRNIEKTFIILEESQNLSKNDIKTILTRVSNGSKIVIVGDHFQIDNHYLSPITSGLTCVIEAFKFTPLAGSIFLQRGERSPIATMASQIL